MNRVTDSIVSTGVPLDGQTDAVKAASKTVTRVEAALKKRMSQEEKALADCAASRERARTDGGKRHLEALLRARQRARESAALRKETAMQLREARKLLREQRQLSKEIERKNKARKRAVAAFLKKWDRQYDLEMKRKKKNIKLRREEIRKGDC